MQPHKRLRYLRRCYRDADLREGNIRWFSSSTSRYYSCSDPKPESLGTDSLSPPIPRSNHRTLGTSLNLFSTHPSSPGSPFFPPDGAHIFQKLKEFLRAQYPIYGFREVVIPIIYKKSLWETSGHWEHYKNDMFHISKRWTDSLPTLNTEGQSSTKQIGENEDYSLKPMNCPGHCLLYKSQLRSWRDLPLRYADFSALHRNEVSGALSSLTRVRRFHQDDGHIFCTRHQIEAEVQQTLDFVDMIYSTFNLGPYKLVLSTRPQASYIGEEDEWHDAEYQLKFALQKSGKEWEINPGEGAFYGPKIDIILKDSVGKEHQTATIQLDFQLPRRFGLEYQAGPPGHGMRTPVIIHRAILGSLERFMALLIEHYEGHWPFWLSPRQMMLCTVTTKHHVLVAAKAAAAKLSRNPGTTERRPLNAQTFIVDIDDTPRPLGKKIDEAKEKKYNLVGVFGERNVEDESIDLDYSAQQNTREVSRILNKMFKRKTAYRDLERIEGAMGFREMEVPDRQSLNPYCKAVMYLDQCLRLMKTLSEGYM